MIIDYGSKTLSPFSWEKGLSVLYQGETHRRLLPPPPREDAPPPENPPPALRAPPLENPLPELRVLLPEEKLLRELLLEEELLLVEERMVDCEGATRVWDWRVLVCAEERVCVVVRLLRCWLSEVLTLRVCPVVPVRIDASRVPVERVVALVVAASRRADEAS